MARLLDPRHPFFRPAWRRAAVVAFCLGWAGVEAAASNGFWAAMFASLGLYAFYHLFVAFKPHRDDNEKDTL